MRDLIAHLICEMNAAILDWLIEERVRKGNGLYPGLSEQVRQ
jgi:hypothetical protein